MESIELPDSVTSIGIRAFSECTSLESIELPDSITSIGMQAFEVCTSLKSVKLPENLTSIEPGSFAMCANLTGIEIPANTSFIGFAAFMSCLSLESITIRNPQCEISENAILEFDNLTIYGYEGSTAQEYAENNDINFVALSDTTEPTTEPATQPTTEPITTPEFKVSDLVALQKWIIGSGELSEKGSIAYDLNKDSVINVFDVVLLRRKLIYS